MSDNSICICSFNLSILLIVYMKIQRKHMADQIRDVS